MGWCGVGTVIRMSNDLSEYPCEYARALPVVFFFFGGGGGGGGNTYTGLPPR